MTGTRDQSKTRSDEAKAIRFFLIKAAIFVLVPIAAAAIAVYPLLIK